MNALLSIVGLLKKGNIWSTLSTVLVIAGSVLASADTNDTGIDHMLASICLSASEGLTAYQNKDMNKAGRIIDAITTGLANLKTQINVIPLPKEIAK